MNAVVFGNDCASGFTSGNAIHSYAITASRITNASVSSRLNTRRDCTYTSVVKRFAIVCLAALPLFGLTRPLHRGDRIGVLRSGEPGVAQTIASTLRNELAERGFEAFDARATFDDLRDQNAPAADFFVEIASSSAGGHALGGLGTAIGAIGVEVGVVRTNVDAELRLYDGRTLALIDRCALQKSSTTVAPTAVGFGARSIWASIWLPIAQHGQVRAAAHEIAREAADRIASR